MHAIRVRDFGGPEVLEWVEVPDPVPGEHQVLVELVAAGVNFADVYQRRGTYGAKLPFIAGVEGAGTVHALGPGVTEYSVGDLVAWKTAAGSYAEQVVVNTSEALRVPGGLDTELAAAGILQGLTAHYLATSAFPVGPGTTALVHAAAGGVGLLLTQIVKLRGGTVIGTVSSEEKEALARRFGADEIIRYDHLDVADEIKRLTGGKGVSVVYDAIGATTFDASLASVAPRGMFVLYGATSGPAPPLDLAKIAPSALFVTRPNLARYTASRDELVSRSDELFGWIADGKVTVHIGGRFPLADASRAHQDLEARRTTGKVLLIPSSTGELRKGSDK